MSPGAALTSLAAWAVTTSGYWISAWNELFLVNVTIFSTLPTREKIWNERAVSVSGPNG